MNKFPFWDDYKDAHIARIEQSSETISKINEWIKNPKRLLYIHGNAGTGKTYICAAIYNYLMEGPVNPRAFLEDDFLRDLRKEIGKGFDAAERVIEICQSNCVILDDMGRNRMNEWQIDMLQTFVDCQTGCSKPTVITSNISSRDLRSTFNERFASRILAYKNIVIDVSGRDRRNPKE